LDEPSKIVLTSRANWQERTLPRFPSPAPKPWTERRIRGITLAQYAAVHAGVAEGWPLDEVLAAEGVPAKVWARADDAWGDALLDTEDEAAEDTHDALFLAAQDRYGRPIPPIDRDLGAWLDLIRAFSADPEPLAFLGRVGLKTNDLLRLHRAWSTRLSEEPLLREEALARVAEPAGPVPVITPEAACSALSPRAHLADAFADDDRGDDDDVDDEPPDGGSPPPPLFAAMPPSAEANNIEPTTAAIAAVATPPAAPAVPQTSPVPVAPAPAPTRPAPSPRRLNETSAFSVTDFVAPAQALPFAAAPAVSSAPLGAPPPPGAPRAPTPPAATPPRPAPSARRMNETSAFSVADFVAPGKALPFAAAPAASKEPAAEALGSAPPQPLTPPAATPPRPAPAARRMNETSAFSVADFVAPGKALPFAVAPSTSAGPSAPRSSSASSAQVASSPPPDAEDITQLPQRSPLRPALPFQPERDPTAGMPLERYAALCAALGESSEDAEVIFARFGLASQQERLTVDLAWRERLRHDPALHAQFQGLYARHRGAPPVPVAVRPPPGAEDITELPQPSPLRPPLPFQPERDTTAGMPLERYTALCVALGESREDAEVIFARFGLASQQERLAVDLAWRERLRREPDLYAQYQTLYAQQRDALRRGDGPPRPDR
jgi:hypothetical protein